MNEKPLKVDIDFNEALRRIAKTPKGLVVPQEGQCDASASKQDKSAEKKKAEPIKKKGSA